MSNQVFYARVKPYNPKRGHVIRRIVCMGTLWEGGSGLPPDTIPVWVRVNAAQAQVLKRFKQIDNDPYSARVFDIVTPEQRKEIDMREEQYRKALLGIGHGPVNEIPDLSAKVQGQRPASSQPLRADGSRMTLEDLKNTDVPVIPDPDDDDEVGGYVDPPAPMPHVSIKAQERDVSGRAEALEGLTEDVSPPMPIEEENSSSTSNLASTSAAAPAPVLMAVPEPDNSPTAPPRAKRGRPGKSTSVGTDRGTKRRGK